MIGAELIVKTLYENGIRHVFTYAGGTIAYILNELTKYDDIKIITCRHEQGASFAAESYARVTGKPSLLLVTSGGGATNIITGLTSAWHDAVPLVVITGQVSTTDLKDQYNLRQSGFQQVNIVDMVKQITKYATIIDKYTDIRSKINEAFKIANTERKGGVLLDIPMNIQIEDYISKCNMLNEMKLISELQHSKKPLVLIGGGCKHSTNIVNEFIKTYDLPVVYSMMGKGVVSDNYKYNCGMIGWSGHKTANEIIKHCDLLIILGSRLDVRQTGNDINEFASNSIKIQIDIDNNELNHKNNIDICINNNIKTALEYISSFIFTSELVIHKNDDWLINCKSIIRSKNKRYKKTELWELFKSINNLDNTILITDVGQNQVIATQLYNADTPESFLTSGGLGTMGYALSASIGAKLANPDANVICVMGDGGFQMNIQELETIVNLGLNIKIIILNNSCLGLVREFQATKFDNNFPTTIDGYSCPNIGDISLAYNIPYWNNMMEHFLTDEVSGILELKLDQNMEVL